uniref:Uncharacterized protein n=1 Tax=Panagrolaimus superbus TaxID=310955 RepID=A0A914Y600_9BILA
MAFSLRNSIKTEKFKRNYLLNTAKLPDLKNPSDAADDVDRDEHIFHSECFKVFKDDRLQRYIIACEVKIKCDIHTLPNKTIPNLINSYYTIKGIGYSFKKHKCSPISQRLEYV